MRLSALGTRMGEDPDMSQIELLQKGNVHLPQGSHQISRRRPAHSLCHVKKSSTSEHKLRSQWCRKKRIRLSSIFASMEIAKLFSQRAGKTATTIRAAHLIWDAATAKANRNERKTMEHVRQSTVARQLLTRAQVSPLSSLP